MQSTFLRVFQNSISLCMKFYFWLFTWLSFARMLTGICIKMKSSQSTARHFRIFQAWSNCKCLILIIVTFEVVAITLQCTPLIKTVTCRLRNYYVQHVEVRIYSFSKVIIYITFIQKKICIIQKHLFASYIYRNSTFLLN